MREEEENDTGINSDSMRSNGIKRLIWYVFRPSPLIHAVRETANTPSSNQEGNEPYITAFRKYKP